MPRSALPACRRPWGGPLGVSRGRCGSITPARAAVQPGSGWVTGAGRRNPRHGLRTRCLPSGRPPAHITGTDRARPAARDCPARDRRYSAGPASIRRGGRAAEGARLESVYTGNRIEGSNPSPSASRASARKNSASPRYNSAGWRRRRRDNRTLRARKTLSPGSGNFLRSALALPIRPEARPWARPGPI
jgi:hypothetical protein